ncbi:hypothetical protein HMPREF1545_03175 [Oscillibacter sp. KLE 1728]|nr:hypothetical protein HMPREF1545_03175 [Oscillibacter sp. KLE 1728]ERK66298.1 hypothetical protein HMPREF1546_00931 [Oscillibacter sp. KLE 1745]
MLQAKAVHAVAEFSHGEALQNISNIQAISIIPDQRKKVMYNF